MNDEKSGSGLLNDVKNNLQLHELHSILLIELHAPGYNFLGPGTKLEKRLARGDWEINPFDEASKEHDIWYRDRNNIEDRWEADKGLQQKAWDRVISKDADLNERIMGLATTGGMWIKRKFAIGLEIETGLNF